MNKKLENESFAYYLTKYFNSYLKEQKGISDNTFSSYKDTFSLFLSYCMLDKHISPDKMLISDFNKELIEAFLHYLSVQRRCKDSSRNQRLAAIHAFFKFIMYESPEHLQICQKVLSVQFKKMKKGTINYLPGEGIKTILEQPDLNTKRGRRDMVLLTTLYDTAARVSEIAGVTVGDLQLGEFPAVKLTGKGSKTRFVAISSQSSLLLKKYMEENKLNDVSKRCYPLFCNRNGESLSRAGISHILKKYADQARTKAPDYIPEAISPHSFRHSKAVHMLQAGVNLIYIRDVLGHESIVTTEVYAKVDSEAKRNAINSAYKNASQSLYPSWRKDGSLLNWLQSLGK